MITCPNCREDNFNSSRNCVKCGTSLRGSTTTPVASYKPTSQSVAGNSVDQKKTDPDVVKVSHYDYGDKRIPFLYGTVTTICAIESVLALIVGVILLIEEEIAGLFIILGGALVAFLTYLFLTCFIYLYSNITVIARNSQIQSAHIQKQTQQLTQITTAQNDLLSGISTVNGMITELCTEYSQNKDIINKQAETLADINTTQAKLIDVQEENTAQLKALHTAADDLRSHSAAAAEAASVLRSKVLSMVTECRSSLETLPARIHAMLSAPSADRDSTEGTEQE